MTKTMTTAMMIEAWKIMRTRTTTLDTSMPASNDRYASPGADDLVGDSLPLVLVTVGNGQGEFELLYDHLESLMQEPEPQAQTLIVARPDVPDVLYSVLRSRVREMPHVYLRRLGKSREDCAELLHSSGTFLAARKRPKVRS